MTRQLKEVVRSLAALERRLSAHEPLRREAATIREAFEDRVKALLSLRKRARKSKPAKPQPQMWIELFLPAAFDGDVATIERLNLERYRDIERWRWWNAVYRGEA